MRPLALALGCAVLVLAGCSDPEVAGGAEVTAEPTRPAATEPPPEEREDQEEEEPADDQAGGLQESGSQASGSSLQSEQVEVAGSELASRVYDTLSGLAAETRPVGSDTEAGSTDSGSDTGSDAEVETVVTLPDTVLFDFDEDDLLPEASASLDELAEALHYFDEAPVQVHGHTDSVGDPDYNQGLSERRAGSVSDYFVDVGVDADRIEAQGFGEQEPVADNTHEDGSDDPDGRAQNRRVEIIIEGVDFEDLADVDG